MTRVQLQEQLARLKGTWKRQVGHHHYDILWWVNLDTKDLDLMVDVRSSYHGSGPLRTRKPKDQAPIVRKDVRALVAAYRRWHAGKTDTLDTSFLPPENS